MEVKRKFLNARADTWLDVIDSEMHDLARTAYASGLRDGFVQGVEAAEKELEMRREAEESRGR